MEEETNIDIIFKIAAVGILIAVLNQVLLRAVEERGHVDNTAGGGCTTMVVNLINNLFNSIKSIFRLY